MMKEYRNTSNKSRATAAKKIQVNDLVLLVFHFFNIRVFKFMMKSNETIGIFLVNNSRNSPLTAMKLKNSFTNCTKIICNIAM